MYFSSKKVISLWLFLKKYRVAKQNTYFGLYARPKRTTLGYDNRHVGADKA